MRRCARFHHQNSTIDGSIEAPWLDLKWVGRKLQSGYGSRAALQTLKLTCALVGCAAQLQWMLLKSTVKYLDSISDGLGYVSQHRNRSMVVVSSGNPQNSEGRLSSSYGNSQHQIITMHTEELGQIPPFIPFPI